MSNRAERSVVLAGVWAILAGAALVGASVDAQDGVAASGGGAGLSDRHASMVASIERGETLVGDLAACFGPGTSEAVVLRFREAIDRVAPDRFQQTDRWSGTVASGPAGAENEPITLTYSFVPDGTFVPNGVGEGAAGSVLFARFDNLYGDTQIWQDLFHQVFDRWEAVSGLRYVYEPNDDGADMFSAPGELGVRGDLRICAKPIDGGSGILAYNFFPQAGGDMVIDSADSFYNDTSADSRRLRNVVAHEHGHGMGQLHVCPVLGDKLMEPFVNTTFDGPLHDDVRNAQDMYGDVAEPNDAVATAFEIGTITMGESVAPGRIEPSIGTTSGLSINEANDPPHANDEDWFRFTTSGAGGFRVRLVPLGFIYEDNPQSCGGASGCCSGVLVDSKRLADLDLQLLDSSGAVVLATAADTEEGFLEEIADWPVSGPETFHLRVYSGSDGFFEPQVYTLRIDTVTPPPPASFGLIYPLNAASDVPTGAVLEWEASAGAESYRVEVDDALDFLSPVVDEAVAAPATQLDLAEGALAGGTTHFWRVTAENPYGVEVAAPAFASFTTESVAPPPGCVGDIDGDGDTDVFDFTFFSAGFGGAVDPPGSGGDYDGDGDVDVFDFGVFAGDFGCVP